MDQNRLLLIEDDADFSRLLKRRLSPHFACFDADNTSDALLLARKHRPSHILMDMKLGDESGLTLIPTLKQLLPHCRLVLLTGFASIATAVSAMRSGADDYLTKPVDTATLLAALRGCNAQELEVQDLPMSPERLEWEHIQQVLKANDGNVSSTARQLGMHRRTLQRKLKKRPALG